MDARRQDQRHLRGDAADQPAHRRAPHPGLRIEGAVVERAPAGAFDLAAILARVPEYREFATLAELRTSSRALVAEFPDLARLETVGASAEGRPIELLTVGHGRTPALLVGVPHPNEPIGTLTIECLTRLVCEDAALRGRLDATIYAIEVADPDGFVLNEG